MKYFGCLILGFVSFLFAELQGALPEESHGLPGDILTPGSQESGLKKLFSSVVETLQDMVAIAAVLGICIAGLMYIMSSGDEEKTEKATKYIIAILIGVLLAFTAWAIISMIDLIPNSIDF